MGYRVIGIDLLNTACECCGREELKKVVILRGPNGDVRFGQGCAARALGTARTGPQVAQLATGRTILALRGEANRAQNKPVGMLHGARVLPLLDGRLYLDVSLHLTAADLAAAYPERRWVQLSRSSWVTAA